MFLPQQVRVFAATSPVDFRKSYDGLCGIVRETLKQDPFSQALFVFFNKKRDQVKILWSDEAGICLWSKRLYEGCFQPTHGGGGTHAELNISDLAILLQGMNSRLRHRK